MRNEATDVKMTPTHPKIIQCRLELDAKASTVFVIGRLALSGRPAE